MDAILAYVEACSSSKWPVGLFHSNVACIIMNNNNNDNNNNSNENKKVQKGRLLF